MKNFNWCIDAGNSSVKWGVFYNNVLREVFQFKKEPSLKDLKWIKDKYPPRKIAVASVRHETKWLKEYKPLYLTASTIAPFNTDYTDPLEMGVDRLAAAMGAQLYSDHCQSTLIVDLGTCITYTKVVGYCISGLAISPGLQMRWDSMNHFTAKLPLFHHNQKIEGNGTLKNLYVGGLSGWQKELKGMIELFCETLSIDKVIITGSDVVHLEQYFNERFLVIDHLNLLGLNIWLNEG